LKGSSKLVTLEEMDVQEHAELDEEVDERGDSDMVDGSNDDLHKRRGLQVSAARAQIGRSFVSLREV
jgi:hypothetical protein